MRPRSLYVSLILASAPLAHSGCVDLTEPWSMDSGVDQSEDQRGPYDAPKKGLLASYTCDEKEFTYLIDHTNNGRNAKVEGTPTWTIGKQGGAADFGGAAYAAVPAGILNGATEVTLATWVNLNSNPAEQHVFDFSSAVDHAIELTTSSGTDTRGPGYIALRVGMGTSSVEVPGPAGSIGVWTHWAVVGNGTTWDLFMDGYLAAEVSGPAVKDLGITNANWIGRSRFSEDPYLDGAIDDFQIYNRALTADEVRGLAGQ